MFRTSAVLSGIFAIAILLISCGNDPAPTGPNTPEEPDPTNVTLIDDAAVPSGGGVLIVDRQGHPLDGLTITVPTGAYSQTTAWTVSEVPEAQAPVVPAAFRLVGPAIRIANGQGYAARPFHLTLPARVGPDSAVAAFFHDPSSGTFELIPTVGLTDSTITVLTRHLSADQLLIPASAAAPVRAGGSTPAFGEVVVVVVATSDQRIRDRKDSGFRPGKDDWEFINYGSVINPGGFCTGSTLSALYYHYALKSSRGQLFGKYDSVSGFWADNPQGIRLAAQLQNTMDWGAGDRGMQAISDSAVAQGGSWVYAQAASLSMSIQLTGRPQQVAIYRPDGSGGHAVIAFATQWGLFFIADPNEPGVERHITYENGAFTPFPFSTNASTASDMYDRVFVLGVTALVPVSKFERDWQAFDNGTAGDSEFPSVTFEYLDPVDTVWVPVPDSIVTASDTLLFRNLCQGCPYQRTASTPANRGVTLLHDAAGAQIDADSDDTGQGAELALQPGTVRIAAELDNLASSGGPVGSYFTDFRWLTVTQVPFDVTADTDQASVGDEITFTVEHNGLGDATSRYRWQFGDDTATTLVVGTATAKHTYSENGTFTAIVELRDASDVIKARDSVTVSVGPVAWRFDSIGVVTTGAQPVEWWEVEGIGTVDALGQRLLAAPSDGLLIPGPSGSSGLSMVVAPAGTGAAITTRPEWSYGTPFHTAGGRGFEVLEGEIFASGDPGYGVISGTGEHHWGFSCVTLEPTISATSVGGTLRGTVTLKFQFENGTSQTQTWHFRARPFGLGEAGGSVQTIPVAAAVRRC